MGVIKKFALVGGFMSVSYDKKKDIAHKDGFWK